MPASITSPADIVNLSLGRIGYRLRVASLYDGSEAATRALDLYAQTRDELLRQNDWAFAERQVTLTQLKTAPANYFDNPWNPVTMPPIGWLFEYAYPADALKIRSVVSPPSFLLDVSPKPNLFNVYNDNAGASPQKTIVCNIANAVAIYTGQVTNPAQMEPDFIEAFAAALARRLATLLADLQTAGFAAQDETQARAVAEMERG